MKKIFTLVLLATIINSCCNNKDTIIYNLTNEEKALLPYEKQDVIVLKSNNGTISNGTVLEKTTSLKETNVLTEYACKEVMGESIAVRFNIDNSPYYMTLDKLNDSRIDLSISSNAGKENQITFYCSIGNLNSFGTVSLNGEVFENSIKVYGDVPNNTLIYSKTNGIEFILFADGTWYKRVE